MNVRDSQWVSCSNPLFTTASLSLPSYFHCYFRLTHQASGGQLKNCSFFSTWVQASFLSPEAETCNLLCGNICASCSFFPWPDIFLAAHLYCPVHSGGLCSSKVRHFCLGSCRVRKWSKNMNVCCVKFVLRSHLNLQPPLWSSVTLFLFMFHVSKYKQSVSDYFLLYSARNSPRAEE